MRSTRLGGRSASTGNNRTDDLVTSRIFQDAGTEKGCPRHLQYGVRFVTVCGNSAAPVPGLDGIDACRADEKVVQLRRLQVDAFDRDVPLGAEVQDVGQDELI